MEIFQNLSFQHPVWLPLFTAITFVIVFARYLVISGAFHYVCFVWFRSYFQPRYLHTVSTQRGQMQREIRLSALTSLIFSVLFAVMFMLWQAGYTRIYLHWSDYSWWYHPISLVAAMLLHETYYYWLHRWMHRPRVYRLLHRWHHESIHTASTTSFSFHPLEAVLQALIIPLLIMVLPMHYGTLFFFLIVMTLSGTINHAGVEVYPKNFERHWLGRWIIGATHHDLHHRKFQFNYGLYFTFWDKWMKTEWPGFEKLFREKTGSGGREQE